MPLDSIGYLSPTSYVETKIVDADGEVLRRAADILEDGEWMTLGDEPCIPDNAYCLVTAIIYASGFALPLGAEDRFARRLGFPNAKSAIDWNDCQAQDKAEVIARLRSAAEQGAS